MTDSLTKTTREKPMTYTDRQFRDALKKAITRFYRSAGLAGVVGAIGLYGLSESQYSADVTASGPLFGGFIVGFFVAGIVIPQLLRKALYEANLNREKSSV